MNQTLVQQKREYIRWFMDTCILKENSCRALLELLVEHNHLLRRIRIVENLRYAPNAILISAGGTRTVSFLYRLHNKHIGDLETMMFQLVTNPPEEIYLWLSFDREKIAELGGKVVEGKSEKAIEEEFLGMLYRIEKSILAKGLTNKVSREKLLQKIDKALDNGDREKFAKLSKIFKKAYGSIN